MKLNGVEEKNRIRRRVERRIVVIAPNKRIEPEPVQAGGKNRRPLAQARLMQTLCAARRKEHGVKLKVV